MFWGGGVNKPTASKRVKKTQAVTRDAPLRTKTSDTWPRSCWQALALVTRTHTHTDIYVHTPRADEYSRRDGILEEQGASVLVPSPALRSCIIVTLHFKIKDTRHSKLAPYFADVSSRVC